MADEKEPTPDQVSLDWMASNQMFILYRQIKNLLIESKKGLLSPTAAAAFSDSVKLRQSLSKEERDKLDTMSEEQLEKLAGDRGLD